MLNPLDYDSDISAGIATIQASASGSGTASRPLHIYIPPGTYTLITPISITRHYVELEIDAGAIIYVPSGISGLRFDGSLNSDGFIMHLVVRMNGRIEGQSGSVDGVYADDIINSDLFFNEVRWVSRDGIRFDGACFSNRIRVNRVHGTDGWNMNVVGSAFNANAVDGEFAYSNASGGLRLSKAIGCEVRAIVQNQQTSSSIGVLLDSCRDNRVTGWFEGNQGTDVKIQATELSSFNNVIMEGSEFFDQKTSPNYNIDIQNSTYGVRDTHIGACSIYNVTRGLNIGSSVSDTYLDYTDIPLGSITNSSDPSELHFTEPLEGILSWDPANLADGTGVTSSSVTVTGAAFGHRVEVAAPYDLQGILCTGYVSGADTVKIRLQNETGGAINLASGNWRVIVRRD